MNRHKDSITQQLRLLTQGLEVPMADLAGRCSESWSHKHGLEQTLAEGIFAIPHCHLVYALDMRGVQVSCSVTLEGVSEEGRGQDLSLSVRPYLRLDLHPETLKLCDASISRITGRTCLTALRAVEINGLLLGLLAADFDLQALSMPPGPLRDAC